MKAAEVAVLVAVTLLAVVAPRSLAALVEPVVRMIEMVRVGDNTQILRQGPRTIAEVATTAERFRQQVANDQMWMLSTPYGCFFSPGSWLPARHRDESSALRWEEEGVSYSLMGRSLTREEAVDLFLSLRPIDEAP